MFLTLMPMWLTFLIMSHLLSSVAAEKHENLA